MEIADAPPAKPVVAGRRSSGRVAAALGRAWFWVAIAAVGFLVPIASRVLRSPPAPLPILGVLPDFTLVGDDGRPFGAADLRGKVWLANFVFTRCPTICPALTEKMAGIQKRARGIETDFRLVSFSVDPEFDTPAVLAEYARRHRASPRLWRFVTGSIDGMKTTVTDGLKISMGEPAGEQDFESIFHGTHFVLVDRQMRIRAYYDSGAPDLADQVLADAAMLLNRGD